MTILTRSPVMEPAPRAMPADPLGYREGLIGRIGAVCADRCYRHVGSLTGTNHETTRRYVQGLSRPTPEFLAALCEVFGIAPLWLLCGRGPMLESRDSTGVRARWTPSRAAGSPVPPAKLTNRPQPVRAQLARGAAV